MVNDGKITEPELDINDEVTEVVGENDAIKLQELEDNSTATKDVFEFKAEEENLSMMTRPGCLERYRRFITLLHMCSAEMNMTESLEVQLVRDFCSEKEENNPFTDSEIDVCLKRMESENKVMRDGNQVFFDNE